jgi:hypothetical protein
MGTRICFSGKSRFKRENNSKKEDLFQFKIKGAVLSIPHSGNNCQAHLLNSYWR